MDVRKGTFRLWVVLSVLFVIGVTVVSYSDIRTEFRNTYTDWDAEIAKYGGYTVVPTACDKARGIFGNDYSRNDDGLCWYELSRFRLLYPEYKDLSDKDLAKKLYSKAGRPLVEFHPWDKVLKTAAMATGVPLALLTLGWSLFWALSGFKPQTPVSVSGKPTDSGDLS